MALKSRVQRSASSFLAANETTHEAVVGVAAVAVEEEGITMVATAEVVVVVDAAILVTGTAVEAEATEMAGTIEVREY